MELKILNTHQGRPKNDVHGLYEWLFWDIEITHDHDVLTELQRNDIWEFTPEFGDVKRYDVDFEKSQALKKFCDEFGNLKDRFFKMASGNPCFKHRWTRDPDYYASKVVMATRIIKDLPGHYMRPHLDNSHIMVQTIVNLVDNPSSTEIYEFDNQSPIHQSSRKKNQGLAFFNNSGAVHGIKNEGRDRYVLYSALMLE